ncbi:MAG: hypothetical protein ACM3OB_07260 [Acidobacteriota bacterium]
MSCPDTARWQALLAHRFEPAANEPAGLAEAMEHLDACPTCRRVAVAIDPSLTFRTLRRSAAVPGEVEAMRQAVAGLRRARELGERIELGEPPAPRRWPRWALRAAAAAGFTVLLAQAYGPRAPVAPPVHVAATAAAPAAARAIVPVADGAAAPLLEETDRPGARVYQLGGRDLAVVMIVDKSLDV